MHNVCKSLSCYIISNQYSSKKELSQISKLAHLREENSY